MSDLIDRQAAIMDAESWVAVDEHEKHLQKNVIEWLKEFPPAELGTDTISRQAALEKVRAMQTYKLFVGDDMILVDKAEVQTELMMLPTAQTEPQWIPVSERLPMEFEFVNCTCHSLIDDREDWVVETVYIPQPSDSPYSDWGNIPMLNSGDCKVVAWVHRDIPQPYKAESEDKE